MPRILTDTATDELKKYILELYNRFIPARAVPPDLGGPGELKRAEVLEEELNKLGLKVERVEAHDPRAEGGVRPNILAILPGRDTSRTLWVVAHLDTVPEGDRGLWKTDPYTVVVDGDKVYGRGVEDNGQGIVLALAAARYLAVNGLEPRVNLGIALVSDEETGSRYGLQYLLEKGVFGSPETDWFLVPDAGSPDGSKVIVAEKHIAWIKVTVKGRQTHASMPHTGLNAHRLGMMFNLELDTILHTRFTRFNEIFEPPVSTFEPTKKESNVGNVNTIPGVDTVYWDMRILPDYTIEDVLDVVRAAAYNFSARTGAQVEVEPVALDEAGKPTDTSHDFVKGFLEAIHETRGIEPRAIGIGGGTVARYLRRHGYQALVWMTCDETAHQPNEYTRLSYIVADVDTLLHYLLNKA
ncbi:M20 family metallo-hydrolase [Pyrodictium abyssi]|uniref:M20 family metallo-hydrolase n=1 Tax=Pyrodictium abyssi TaxID=54256 RepID=A0ABM8ITH7_9CREN|nr:M20 family metallo-hydrolase [Pyrodictium abyssi]